MSARYMPNTIAGRCGVEAIRYSDTMTTRHPQYAITVFTTCKEHVKCVLTRVKTFHKSVNSQSLKKVFSLTRGFKTRIT